MRIGRKPKPAPTVTGDMAARLRAFERDLVGWTVSDYGVPHEDLRHLLLDAAMTVERLEVDAE